MKKGLQVLRINQEKSFIIIKQPSHKKDTNEERA